MNRIILIALLLLSFGSITYSQQPSGNARPRRGLDQIDLLSVPKSAESSTIDVDLDTFKLLGPLIENSRELERDHAAAISGTHQPIRTEYYETIGRKTLAIYRSIFLIKEMDKLAPPVEALVNQNEEIAKDIGRVVSVIRFGNATSFKKEMGMLFEQYGISESADYTADRQQLVAAMLRQLNANFAKFRVAG